MYEISWSNEWRLVAEFEGTRLFTDGVVLCYCEPGQEPGDADAIYRGSSK